MQCAELLAQTGRAVDALCENAAEFFDFMHRILSAVQAYDYFQKAGSGFDAPAVGRAE
jgi:hypothetical protein